MSLRTNKQILAKRRNRIGVNVKSVIVVSPNRVVHVRAGLTGAKGADGVMSESNVISIINQHVHSINSVDAINVTNGRISIDIQSLPDG